MPDGKIEKLLDESQVSNGVQGYNSTSINIAYVGGIDSKGRAIDNRTQAQKDSLYNILFYLKQQYQKAHIMGHRDIWGKDSKNWKKMCPCFDAEKEYAELEKLALQKYPTTPISVPNSPLKPKEYIEKIKSLAPWITT